jgi:hypothetical protein
VKVRGGPAGLGEGASEVENTGGVVSTNGAGPPAVAGLRGRRRRNQKTRRMINAKPAQTMHTTNGNTVFENKPMMMATTAIRTKPMVTISSTKSPSGVAGQEITRKRA